MHKVKHDTASHRKRISWAIIRCLVGLAGAAFFLYFLDLSVIEYNHMVQMKTLAERFELAEFAYECLSQERRVVVAYIATVNNTNNTGTSGTKKRETTEGEASTDFDIVNDEKLQEALDISDENLDAMVEGLPQSMVGPETPIGIFVASLADLRASSIQKNISLEDVVRAYSKGIFEIWLVWSIHSRTPSPELNALLDTDIFIYGYLESFRQERDYTVAFLTAMKGNLTSTQVAEMLTILGTIYARRDILYGLLKTEAIPAQLRYLQAVIDSPEFILVNNTFYNYRGAVYTALYSTFNDQDEQYPTQTLPSIVDWLNTTNSLLRFYKGLDVEDIEPLQDNLIISITDSVITQLSVAGIGTGLEIFAALSIIYMAIPVLRLLWRLSSSQSMSRTRGKENTAVNTTNTNNNQITNGDAETSSSEISEIVEEPEDP